jgi:hypothetical protein
MTSISFGGGPSIEARRSFTNLKEGSQVPGYGGYIHQLKYNNGHTYGDHTHLLSARYPTLSRSNTDFLPSKRLDISYKDNNGKYSGQVSRSGDSTHLNNCIPGYTGYIPLRKFDFSDTYKVECNRSIDSFMDKKQYKNNKNSSIVNYVNTNPKHVSIASNDQIRDVLNNYINRPAGNFLHVLYILF